MTRHARFRVLHVVESYGGGVASAIDAYVAATPELEHHILRRRREGSLAGDASAATFASVTDLPGGPQAVLAVRRALAVVRPAVLHAHSSRAGVYARLAVRDGRHVRIVYTPHCFAFERRNISLLVRTCCYVVERSLALNTGGCRRLLTS
ncbi:glycosyltransferase [Georgenia sp. SUBG003]|uniref:glycosyltransferase n=1 Tax=Georgenia sp. SUBG003 TaxID=1497974 RepID=UPI0005BC89F7